MAKIVDLIGNGVFQGGLEALRDRSGGSSEEMRRSALPAEITSRGGLP